MIPPRMILGGSHVPTIITIYVLTISQARATPCIVVRGLLKNVISAWDFICCTRDGLCSVINNYTNTYKYHMILCVLSRDMYFVLINNNISSSLGKYTKESLQSQSSIQSCISPTQYLLLPPGIQFSTNLPDPNLNLN